MAKRFFFRTLSNSSLTYILLRFPSPISPCIRSISPPISHSNSLSPPQNKSGVFRNFSHGTVSLILSQGKPKFETHEVEPPKKEKWKTKKQLKLKRKKEKQKRKAANKRDPRRLGVKGKKQKFQDAEERIKYKIERAKVKEAQLIERLKRYEVPRLQGPAVEPENLTGEERFYLQKMGQKRSNYAPIGRRGIFGGVIQNMHMHWKKHETVKVICNKACKRDMVHEFAKEIARLSGGTPIQIIGNDTIVFYRGRNYVQPKEMLPSGTLSKKKALEKSKYEQSLESVRRFIAISEKELELYYRHIALYGDPNTRNVDWAAATRRKGSANPLQEEMAEENDGSASDDFSTDLSEMETESEDENISKSGVDSGGEIIFEAITDSEAEESLGTGSILKGYEVRNSKH